ncbi:polysaccharide biosynthesis tyrosine autokinase [Levilinea saccharolytica]|uniref:polysaccharide biosynthesis tyrosine autokinase n=1 Tax=Levilinea saccharolytica TaxID=229921 RepID=UPI00128FC0CD|nr:polysaccharide biosynthesis tyrosine autokinase [Levilinea saccharolytica]
MRWFWLLLLGVLLGGVGGYIGSTYQTPMYQSATKFLVSRAPDQRVSDVGYISDQQLALTYIQLLTTQPVLDAASAKVGYKVDGSQITGQLVRDTLLIQVTVEDSDANRAALIANSLISVLIDQNEIIQASRFAASEESLQAQLKQMEQQIAALQIEISLVSEQTQKDQQKEVNAQIKSLQESILGVQKEISAVSPSGQTTPTPEQMNLIKEKELRLERLQSTLDFYQQIYLNLLNGEISTSNSQAVDLEQKRSTLTQYQQIYSNLLNSYESVRLARLRNTPNVVQVEQAEPAKRPIRPRPLTNAALGCTVGLLIAAGIIFLIEYLDNTIKSPEEIAQLFEAPVIGYIPEVKSSRSREALMSADEPRSPFAESLRSLRTNLEFSSVDKPLRVLLVTSGGPGEGKTTLAANLGMVMAQAGKRVIVVDADLRRPKLHKFLGVNNRVGLSDIFLNHRTIQAITRPWRDSDMGVITSGSLPPNPAELLASDKMRQFIEGLKEQCDIAIIDSPPILVADAAVLASRVDGVLVVMNPGKTDRNSGSATFEQLRRVNARVLGVIFNRIPANRAEYYGGYHHYSQYYSYYAASDGSTPPQSGRKRKETGEMINFVSDESSDRPRS